LVARARTLGNKRPDGIVASLPYLPALNPPCLPVNRFFVFQVFATFIYQVWVGLNLGCWCVCVFDGWVF
jgi:hypothetical protein